MWNQKQWLLKRLLKLVYLLGNTLEESEKQLILQNLPDLKTPKIVVIFAMNEVDQTRFLSGIVETFASNFEQKVSSINGLGTNLFPNQFLVRFDSKKFSALKTVDPILFVNCSRNLQSFVDYLKVADFVIGVSTILHADLVNLNKIPEDSIKIIDDIGNQAIGLLRSQGHLPFVSAITDIASIDKAKHKHAKFYSNRLITEEFGKESGCYFIEKPDDVIKVLHDIQKRKPVYLNWRETRGYFLVDQIELSNDSTLQSSQKSLKLSGYLRNTWGPENLGHITGMGDFPSSQIECNIEVKSKSIARLVKVCPKHDDWRMYNDKQQENMTIEENVEDEQMSDETKSNPDEFADLKKDFQHLTFNQADGFLKRRSTNQHRFDPK